jgi:hypothetical protein
MREMFPEGIFLDYDGTIVANSVAIAIEYTTDFINQRTPISRETVEIIFTMANRFATEQFAPCIFEGLGIGHSVNEYLKGLAKLNDYKSQQLIVRDDFRAFISWCDEKTVQYKICTLQRKDKIMSTIGHIIDAGAIMDIDGLSKARTTDIKRALAGIQAIDRWYMIDDDPFNLRTAKLTGMRSVLMNTSMFSKTEVASYDKYIDHYINKFDDFISLCS